MSCSFLHASEWQSISRALSTLNSRARRKRRMWPSLGNWWQMQMQKPIMNHARFVYYIKFHAISKFLPGLHLNKHVKIEYCRVQKIHISYTLSSYFICLTCSTKTLSGEVPHSLFLRVVNWLSCVCAVLFLKMLTSKLSVFHTWPLSDPCSHRFSCTSLLSS